jgi:hypothetical protein
MPGVVDLHVRPGKRIPSGAADGGLAGVDGVRVRRAVLPVQGVDVRDEPEPLVLHQSSKSGSEFLAEEGSESGFLAAPAASASSHGAFSSAAASQICADNVA